MNRVALAFSLIACLFALTFVNTAEARSRRKIRSINGTFDGVITRLNRTQMAFEVGNASKKVYTVNYDRNTTVGGGGKQGTLDDPRVGQQIKVIVKNNRATKIDVQVAKGGATSIAEMTQRAGP